MSLNDLMYWVVSDCATPTMRPPTTAPTGLSKPPSAAAANENTRIDCIDEACRPSVGMIRQPASAPRAAARAQPSISMRPAGTPASRLDSGFDDTARNARPSLVCWKSR